MSTLTSTVIRLSTVLYSPTVSPRVIFYGLLEDDSGRCRRGPINFDVFIALQTPTLTLDSHVFDETISVL